MYDSRWDDVANEVPAADTLADKEPAHHLHADARIQPRLLQNWAVFSATFIECTHSEHDLA
jgi:hypothetical protein